MQKQLKVSINGKYYAIATDEHEEDIHEAAQLLTSLMQNKIDKISPGGGESMTLVTALQVATDLTKNRKILKACEQRLGNLIALIEREM